MKRAQNKPICCLAGTPTAVPPYFKHLHQKIPINCYTQLVT